MVSYVIGDLIKVVKSTQVCSIEITIMHTRQQLQRIAQFSQLCICLVRIILSKQFGCHLLRCRFLLHTARNVLIISGVVTHLIANFKLYVPRDIPIYPLLFPYLEPHQNSANVYQQIHQRSIYFFHNTLFY